jgi:ATP-dependent Clp protease protease subunit
MVVGMRLSEPNRPEIPYPFPPLRETPRRTDPVIVPLVELPASDPHQQLLDRRRILVSGRLDDAAVTLLCAQLMALDGRSPAPVDVLVNSGGGPVEAIGAVLDVLDLMRATVNATCVGSAVGTAAVLLACATGDRRAGRNARIRLRLEDVGDTTGTADELAQRASDHAMLVQRLIDVLAAATGASADEIAGQLESGVTLDADGARALGVVDRVVERT